MKYHVFYNWTIDNETGCGYEAFDYEDDAIKFIQLKIDSGYCNVTNFIIIRGVKLLIEPLAMSQHRASTIAVVGRRSVQFRP